MSPTEVALAAIAKSAFQLFSSLAKDEFLLLWKSEKEFKRLKDSIETVSCLLHDADTLQSKGEAVQDCVARLRNFMYDAEDFFDGLSWRFLHKKTMDDSVVFPKEEVKLLHGIPWNSLASLPTLYLSRIGGMEQLPDGIQHLTSLQELRLWHCCSLRSVPNWIPQLTSLRRFDFQDCSEELKKRCKKETGVDWPLIRHIPDISIYSRDDESENEEPECSDESENEEPEKIGWCGLFK